MKMPPRRTDQRLFDGTLLVRGLWQGAGLLVLLLGVYAGSRFVTSPDADRDSLARTLTFAVLVLSNLALIQTNRSWGRSDRHSRAESDRLFCWITLGTTLLLGAVLAVPAISRLFSFAQPSPLLLLAALGASALAWLWFECVKRGLRQRPRRVG